MESVAMLVVATFVAMVAAAGFAILRQKPPANRHIVRCPVDGKKASVKTAWDTTLRRHTIVACDHRRTGEVCHEGCLTEVAEQSARPEPTAVMP